MRLSTFLYCFGWAWVFLYFPWFVVMGADWMISRWPSLWISLLALWSILLPLPLFLIASALGRRAKASA